MKKSQWIVLGSAGSGKSHFLNNKKCEEITGFKWRPSGDGRIAHKTEGGCSCWSHPWPYAGELIPECNLVHYCIDDGGTDPEFKDETWEVWTSQIKRRRKAIILITSRKNILSRLRRRHPQTEGLTLFCQDSSRFVEKYKLMINLLKQKNIPYMILNSSNESYNTVTEDEIELIAEGD